MPQGFRTNATYDGSVALSGVEVARFLGQDPDRVFKNPGSVGRSGEHYVFMIPVAAELDLKKLPLLQRKSVSMLKSRELLPLTGYIHGGCSPLGMKKHFRTFIDETAQLFEDSIVAPAAVWGVRLSFRFAIRKRGQSRITDLTVCDRKGLALRFC